MRIGAARSAAKGTEIISRPAESFARAGGLPRLPAVLPRVQSATSDPCQVCRPGAFSGAVPLVNSENVVRAAVAGATPLSKNAYKVPVLEAVVHAVRSTAEKVDDDLTAVALRRAARGSA